MISIESVTSKFKDLLSGIFKRIYDFSRVSCVVNGIVLGSITGIEVSFDVPAVTKVKGFNGDNGYNINDDMSGTLTLRVSDFTNDMNDMISMSYGLSKKSYKPFTVTLFDDNRGAVEYIFKNCIIGNRGSIQKNTDINDMEFTVYFSDCIVRCNGLFINNTTGLLELI